MDINLSDIAGLALAMLLGTAVGLERETQHKSAGLRTNVLICIGACVFTMVSKRMGVQMDSSATRIIAQVVGGIGFLGAGAIIQDRSGAHGLTTAAVIWVVAGVGICCGAGFYALAVATTLLILFALFAFRPLKEWVQRFSQDKNKQEAEAIDKSSE